MSACLHEPLLAPEVGGAALLVLMLLSLIMALAPQRQDAPDPHAEPLGDASTLDRSEHR